MQVDRYYLSLVEPNPGLNQPFVDVVWSKVRPEVPPGADLFCGVFDSATYSSAALAAGDVAPNDMVIRVGWVVLGPGADDKAAVLHLMEQGLSLCELDALDRATKPQGD